MKILVAEDDTTTRLKLVATLKHLGHEVVAVSDGARAWREWQDGAFDVLISDWMMPDLDGIELCRRVRAEPRETYTYLVLLTSLEGKGRFLEGMEAGADDFVTKPFDTEQLAARLHVAQRILGLHEKLRQQATQDRMTGLSNRAAILDALQGELARLGRGGDGEVGVILVDLDHFKRVNDTLGHLAGDDVIREAARRMSAALRPYDRIGRYGGEEFLVVAPGCGAADALTVAERLREAVRATPISTVAGTIPVTVSLGVATARGGEPNAVIALADAALYEAKRAGRDRAVLG